MFIISLVRAPVLLDEERAKEIGRLNLKVQETDDAEKIRSSKKKIERTLGGLVHEGRQLFNKLERCGAPSELSNYVNETEEWKVKVTQELQSAWPTEAPAFQFADVNAAPLGGVGDLVYKARRAKAKVDVPHQRIGRDHEETNLGVFGHQTFWYLNPDSRGRRLSLREWGAVGRARAPEGARRSITPTQSFPAASR